jgi:uncharacterized membrane protein YedE/YeeE
MKYIKFLFLGLLFGIVLTKAEVISWFRIQEMFRFQSFHMYGVIGSAIAVGAAGLAMFRRWNVTDKYNQPISPAPKEKRVWGYLLGGTIFGFGWALTGACPGPIYILIGNGLTVFVVVLLSAVLGTFTYGLLRPKLPH